MISPNKKRDWILRPHTKTVSIPIPNPIPKPISNPRNVENRNAVKGKAVSSSSAAFGNRISSQLAGGSLGVVDREPADWRIFTEAGFFLDESLMETQDREALLLRISKLEHELQEYQHNMGLLLIEKTKLESTYEEQRQSLTETEELLKREKIERLWASSEIEKLTEDLKEALQSGKQRVSDVDEQKEKALMEREKRLEKEWKMLNEEKEKLENLKSSNKERLKNENLIAQEYIQKELESLRLKKASFEASMERERLVFSEKTRNERNQMLRDVEREMQNKLEKMEHDHSKQYLEEQKLELQKEIDKLNALAKKMKDRSQVAKVALEKHVKCRKCGDDISFAISELQFLQDVPKASDKAVEVPEVSNKVAEVPEASVKAVDVLEASLCSEMKTVPGKRGVKRGTRAYSVKKVPEASEIPVNEDCSTAVEALEASFCSELKTVPEKRSIKPTTRGAKANIVKKVAEVSEDCNMVVEVPEASLHPEPKSLPGKRGARSIRETKPKRGAHKKSLKEDSEEISEDCTMVEKAVEASLHSELKKLPSKHGAKPARETKPKRGAQPKSVEEDSEETLDHLPPEQGASSSEGKEGEVDKEAVGDVKDSSVVRGGNKKRRPAVSQEVEVAGGRRYGLRQRKA